MSVLAFAHDTSPGSAHVGQVHRSRAADRAAVGGDLRHLGSVRQVAARHRLDARIGGVPPDRGRRRRCCWSPSVRALGGRWHLLRSGWPQIVAFGVAAVAVPQVAFFYAIQHISVGVAMLLEYLGLVLVVAWQCLSRAGCRGCRPSPASCSPCVGLVLVLDLFGGVRVNGVGVAWGLVAALGLASYFLLSGHVAEHPLPPLVLAGGGMVVAAVGFGILGSPACCRCRSRPVRPSSPAGHCPGGRRSSSSASSRRPRRTSPASSRPGCSARSSPRSWASPRSCSPCCSPGSCSGSCPDRCSWSVACSSSPAWSPCAARKRAGSPRRTASLRVRQRLNRASRSMKRWVATLR